jgi:hypothetical protein
MPGDFQANVYTTSEQSRQAVASRGDGSFVVVWQSNGQNGPGAGVFGQRYDAVGRAQGEFPVNTYTTGFHGQPDVASDRDGNFVVVWESSGRDGSDLGVFGQRFDNSGAKVGSDFQVNTYTNGNQYSARVAAAPAGDFVVVWRSPGQTGSIVGQRFDSSGARAGAEFQVTTDTTESHFSPRVAADGFGNFVVSWTSQANSQGATPHEIAQRFDRSGAKVGDAFPIAPGSRAGSQLAFNRAGGFVCVWGREHGTGDYEVFGQRFNASAEKVGAEFQVNTYTTGPQRRPSVGVDQEGNLLVTWESLGQDVDSSTGIYAQQFDRSGARVGPEFAVNSYGTGYKASPVVASDGFGFVVVWESIGQDGSGRGVFGRRQDPAARPSRADEYPGSGTISNLNGVLEPGETAVFETTWSLSRGAVRFLSPHLTGGFSNFSGPSGGIYLVPDSSADYGSLPDLRFLSRSSRNCHDQTGDCPIVAVAGSRPSVHWDASLVEDLFVGGTSIGGGHLWKLHIGDSFTDVARSQPFYKKIETMLHNGITTGCGAAKYCPGSTVPRDQMAIFIARAMAGSADSVPTSGIFAGAPYNCSAGGSSLFLDISPTDSFCKHVHYLAAQNVTVGCQTATYCPAQTITREGMASFIAKATVAPGGGAAVPLTYGPDPVTGLSYSCAGGTPNVHFSDVPATNPFCKHIHFLWAKGIVSGCSATQYCPSQPVNRDAMAKFIANGFGLELYGP